MVVWEQVADQGYRPAAWQVKRMLTEERVPANSAMARLRGHRGLRGRGRTGAAGPVRRRGRERDLAGGPGAVAEPRHDEARRDREGPRDPLALGDSRTGRWTGPRSPATDASRRSLPPQTREETAELERLRTREDELSDLDEEDWTEELEREAEAIETRTCEINAAVEARATFRTEDCAMAGCIATIDWRGDLQIVAGLVRPEDMPKPGRLRRQRRRRCR